MCGKSRVVLIVMMSSNTSSTYGTELSVLVVCSVCGLWSTVALEPSVSATFGVSVGRRWTETLLFLVVTSEEHLNESTEKEEESSDDGDSESSLVETASEANLSGMSEVLSGASSKVVAVETVRVGIAASKRRVDIASSTFLGAIACEDSESDESSAEKYIHQHSEEGKECLASQAASQDDREDGVYNGSTRDTLNSFLPCRDRDISISLYGKEVRVNA
jgi:hypothetical protein